MWALIKPIMMLLMLSTNALAQSATEILTDHISRELASSYPVSEYQVNVVPKVIPQSFGGENIVIVSVKLSGVGVARGYCTYDVHFQKDGINHTAKTQYLIEVQQLLPVPKVRIEAGQALNASLFRKEWVDITRLRGAFMNDMEELDGYVSARMIREGTPLRPNDLALVPIVKPGDSLKMLYEHAGVQLSLNCTARQTAAKGERIRVYSEMTRKTYLVRIINATTAKWENTL